MQNQLNHSFEHDENPRPALDFPFLGLVPLFILSFAERFAYYGMRAVLLLYMVSETGLSMENESAFYKYGTLSLLVVAFLIPGGLLTDFVLKEKKAILVGIGFLIVGYLLLAFGGEPFLVVAFLMLGIGFGLVRPGQFALIGKQFTLQNSRRKSAYIFNYFMINAGAFLAPIMLGQLGENVGWGYAFMASAGIMLLIGGGFALLMQFINVVPQKIFVNQKEKERDPGWLLTAGMCMIGLVLFWIVYELKYTFQITQLSEEVELFNSPFIGSLNPVFLMAFGLITGLGFLFLNKPSTIGLIGAGFVLFFCTSLATVMWINSESLETASNLKLFLVVIIAVESLAELFVGPVLFSFLGRIVSSRLTASLFGFLLTSGFIAGKCASLLQDSTPEDAVSLIMMFTAGPLLATGLFFILGKSILVNFNSRLD